MVDFKITCSDSLVASLSVVEDDDFKDVDDADVDDADVAGANFISDLEDAVEADVESTFINGVNTEVVVEAVVVTVALAVVVALDVVVTLAVVVTVELTVVPIDFELFATDDEDDDATTALVDAATAALVDAAAAAFTVGDFFLYSLKPFITSPRRHSIVVFDRILRILSMNERMYE